MKATYSIRRFAGWTWGAMVMGALLLGGWLLIAAFQQGWHPPWFTFFLIPLFCLLGPLLLLFADDNGTLPFMAGAVVVYGLSILWLFRKPSAWSKAVFITLSVLWLLIGTMVVAVGL